MAADHGTQRSRGTWRFDAVLAGLLVLAFATPWPAVIVGMTLVVLAVAAFQLSYRPFVIRLVVVLSLACLDVILAVRTEHSHLSGHELIGLLPATALAIAVFTIARVRSHELEAMREISSQMHDLVESIPAIVYITDLRNEPRHVFVSPFVEESMGVSAEDWVSDPTMWERSITPDDHGRVMEAVDRHHTTGDPLHIDYGVVDVSGKPRVLRVSARAHRDDHGQIVSSIGVASEITELEEATVRAEQASAAKDAFLSRVSHELRTPLNAISGFAQLLELDSMEASQRESVSQIVRAGEHLLQLINELLDIARIESGELALSVEPVSVGEIVRDASELIAPIAMESQVTLITEPGPWLDSWLLADYQRLRQILLNLLSNAVKYGGAGATVLLRPGQAESGSFRIVVSDTGSGIPMEDLDRIFRPFERLVADDDGIVGSGIGLAVTRTMTEAMGGSIGVESEVGIGSAFWVEFPSYEPSASERSHLGSQTKGTDPEPEPHDAARPDGVVLYIEDNPSNIRLVERVLARRPTYHLLTATDATSGIEMALHADPDLILLDLNLPDMSGQEAMARLRADDATASIQIAIVSADATTKRRDELLADGAWRFVTKPLDIGALLATVDEAMDAAAATGDQPTS